jgi:ppGpp synthetase/RelA/SpoT-type nucleotidyltranferase
MTFEEYEKLYHTVYAEFAETIRFILAKAIDGRGNLPATRFIQQRAKDPESLWRRLDEAGKLDTSELEVERKDLAGVRLIFYTNNDVERFLKSQLVFETFEVEHDSTKIHTPVPDNPDQKYRGIHYIVRLRDDRTTLPEYAKFAGLRCEIQIQTILNHAWSETSHDIVYKGKATPGFGSRAMAGIGKRFNEIMDKFLLPAGYEIQKVQNEYEQLLQGKELFDKDVVKLLTGARNNNERYELLTGLRDYAIPNYDDLTLAFDTLRKPLLDAARSAKLTDPVAVESVFGSLNGHKATDVVRTIVEIFSLLRYSNVNQTFMAFGELVREEQDADVRKQILEAVKQLAEYNIDAWEQVGPHVQLTLVDQLRELSPKDIDAIRAVAIAVWREVLESDITGTRWRANSVTLSSGAVPFSNALREVRTKALDGLLACFERSAQDSEKSELIAAMDAATRTPTQGNYSNELLDLTLQDASRIVEFMTNSMEQLSFEIRQHYEHSLLFDYHRAVLLADEKENKFKVQTSATRLLRAIEAFRNHANQEQNFVRYKVLVGFDSVYPGHWEDPNYDFRDADVYRKGEADKYIEEIDVHNEAEWFRFLERCAATKSEDMATFPVFGEFLVNLTTRKPDVADRCFARGDENLSGFLPALLNGLQHASANEIYERNVETILSEGNNLSSLARHLRNGVAPNPTLAGRVLTRAISANDEMAVIESFVLVMERFGTGAIENEDEAFRRALRYLSERNDTRWVRGAWFQPTTGQFFAALSPENAKLLLDHLVLFPTFDHQLERIVRKIAERHLGLVWDFCGNRLKHEDAMENDDPVDRYQAIPFRFHGLETELSRDPTLAIAAGREWFNRDDGLFRFKGGRLLSNAFPGCTSTFADALAVLATQGTEKDVEFILDVLQNYHGEESCHEVLKPIVARCVDDERKMSEVRISLDSTGVVSGEFGMVEALRAKKAMLRPWLDDERPEVKAFAVKHMRELDIGIAAEQLRAEQDREMRQRNYPDSYDVE